MTARTTALVTRTFIVISLGVFCLFGYGCSNSDNSSTITAQFLPSSTPQTPLLVKLAPATVSGSLMVVEAVIYGPGANLDLYAFAFDIKIGDPTMVKFVAGTAVGGNALTPVDPQTIVTNASVDAADASHVVVGVSKTGGGAGNDIPGTSAIVVQLTFQALKAGATTLAITGTSANPSQPPAALDSTLQPIASITFDTAPAAVTATASGGGY